MINSIFGTITAKFPQTVCIETANGIEWELFVSDVTLNSLPDVGQQFRIYTVLHHKEDVMKLFGFSSIEERSLYNDLLKVEGVGPKGAMKILSSVSYESLVKILDEEDINTLEKVPGVGKKTAQKMLLALKGKLSLARSDSTARSVKKSGPWEDVVVGLVNMGYERNRVETTVEKIASTLDSSLSQSQKEEQILRRAIVELAV